VFSVLMADNPWKFRNEKSGGNHQSGASQKYPCMELDEIKALPVQSVLRANSSLWLWVPTRLKFSHGESTLVAWGFRYVTTIYWGKDRLGMGFHVRNQAEELYVGTKEEDDGSTDDEAEELLVGVRGALAPFRYQGGNVVLAPREKHSGKPEIFREIVEKATGHNTSGRCLEMFGRKPVPGWTVIGNQAAGDGEIRADIRADLRRLALERASVLGAAMRNMGGG
jgi:N6-adenosine-specific RNA methylase IME4